MLIASLGALGLSQAAEAKTLTVYTYDSFVSKWGPGPKVKAAFEAQCDCTLNLVGLDDAVSILSRLRLEGVHSKADIALGLDSSMLHEAAATGLFMPHGLDLSGLTIPTGWKNPIFAPFDYGYFAFIYDSDKMKTPPSSLRALVEATDGPKLLIQDPRTSSPGLGLMLWMKKVYGAEAGAAWAKLAPRIVTVTKGWSEAYGLFLKGESDMVLSYTTSPAYHMIAENKNNYRAAAMTDGQYMQVETAAKLKSASEPELADQFLRFMISDAFQSIIPTGNWMYPVTDIGAALPEAFGKLIKVAKPLRHSPSEIAENRKAWTSEWRDALSK
ncbi:MAG: thiamine ABC transporter substrate binding subunit [Proteobacteria bacterium]|nr:thiamine ABC transporter substrate binding subunit [Pseudomonadota bacterium]